MQTKTILIRGGLVQDAVHREPRKVDLLLAGGKIWTPPLTPRCSTRRACRYFPGLWTPTPT